MNGQCYPNSFNYMVSLTALAGAEKDPAEKEKFNDLVLIHGDVIPTEGPDEGRIIDHAWVEMAGHAFDVAEDIQKPATKPIDEFHERLNVKVRASYTISEALSLVQKTQMYGPWDAEGRVKRELNQMPPENHNG
jgi:hypothetical protein